MTTEPIEVVVTERGARGVEEAINRIAKGAESAAPAVDKLDTEIKKTGETGKSVNGIMGSLKATLVGIAVGIGVKGIMAMADSYNVMAAQVRRVTADANEFKAVNTALYDVARQTGSGIQDVTAQYTQLATATKSLGVSQGSVIGITKSLNDMMEAAGASSGETTSAVNTLSLGFARGTITTREYTQLMRSSKGLFGDVIAKEMGITTQALDEMVRSGQLSATKLVEVMDKSKGAFAALAADMPMTFGKAMTMLGTSFTQLIGQLNESTGVLAVFYSGIVLVANNLDTIATALAFGAAAWGLYSAAVFVAATNMTAGSVAAGILRLALMGVSGVLAFIAANPLVALVTAVGLGVAALLTFGSQTQAAATLLDHLSATMTVLGAIVGKVWEGAIKPAWDEFIGILQYLWDMFVAFGKAVMGILSAIADAIGIVSNAFIGTAQAADKASTSISSMYGKALADSRANRAALEAEREALERKRTATNGVAGANDNQRGATDRARYATDALTGSLATAGQVGKGAFDGIASAANGAASAINNVKAATGQFGNVSGGNGQFGNSTSGGSSSGGGTFFLPHTPESLARMEERQRIAGFARGGSFRVGGADGRDRNLVQFKASKGETVEIKTPAQQREAESGGSTNAGKTVVIEKIELIIPGVQNPNDFRNSERQIMQRLSGAIGKAVR
jgi:tape measure domain-containing protein